MNTFTRRSFTAGAGIFMASSLIGCARTSNPDTKTKKSDSSAVDTITIVLDWTPNTNHTGIYSALAKGYFKDEGINVEVVQPPEDGAEVLVASGKATFGVSFQDVLAPALIGENALPVTCVAALIQHNTSGILSRKGEGMEHPRGLENHTYATWDLPVEKAIIKNVVETDGGDFSKINLVPSTVTDEVSALSSKSIDALWVYYAWAGIACEIADLDCDYFAFKDENAVFDYYTPIIIANNDFLDEQPVLARAFMSALAKGYEFAIQNPEDAADILIEANPELADSQELIVASQRYLANEYTSDASQWGIIDPARWNGFYTWLSENDLLDQAIPKNIGFTNDFLPER